MKFVKTLGLFALVAASLMAFTASAPATTVTSPAGTAYTGEIFLMSEGHVVIHNPIAKIECEALSTIPNIAKHGNAVTAEATLESFLFFHCTNEWHVTTVSQGSIEIHHLTGTNHGTVTSSGMTIEATRFGVTCRYKTLNTDIGTLTGGIPATFHLEGALPFHSGSPLCGAGTTKWTGSFNVTTPSKLFISA
ncbi:MAG TPA: hypothetical protein VFS54_07355 [Solirubrobacterales bacterium]|nr:hypothetical protein [Solirubrobacterales bacterium]